MNIRWSLQKRPFRSSKVLASFPESQLGSYIQHATDSFIPLPIAVACTFLAAVGGAHFLYAWFDKPIRAYLTRKFSLN
ncbi:hypothetical protein [Rhizobium ruizarguesonis]|uniref:hypothetical protein n=1 Tax=Rhizobium ruizarguesonis TaxID=2081791 RepID=UPI00296258D6|nr:hypothetical protein [Rhizobium ruizarguesonis]